jgi:glutamine amidotransferase
MKKKIGILNYGTGNISSLKNVILMMNMMPIYTSNINKLSKCDAIILPGVGSFDTAVNYLKKKKIDIFLKKIAGSDVKIIGICLGMEIMCNFSEESADKIKGLGLFNGNILKLKKSNIGWRKILLTKNFENSYDLKNIFYYFNHNYYFDGKKNDIFAYVHNMQHIPAIISKNNLFGIQFHPEKSHAGGIQILHEILNHS